MGQFIRYDNEFTIAECFKALMVSDVSGDIQATHPVVAWFDPAAWDSGANRIVALCTDGSSKDTGVANATMTVEVGVKTVFSQAKAEDDYNLHRTVTDYIRAFFAKEQDALLELLNAQAEKGFKFDFISPGRDYSSDCNGQNIYSSVRLQVKCFSVREEQE